MKRKKGIFRSIFSVIGVLSFFLALCLNTINKPAYGGEVITKYMVAGKEYRVEKIEGEPGKYMVFWGDDQYKWEPLSYMPDYYLKEGPLFFDRWIKPGNPYPWDNSLEERNRWDAKKIWTMCVYQQVWWATNDYEHAVAYPTILIDPKGRERVKIMAEYGKGYFTPEAKKTLPKELQGVLGRKYMYIMLSPDDVSGVAGLSFSYLTDKPDDIWFYTPSVRKIRRLSEGSRQDFMPGSTYRNEDFVITRPFHNYKIVKTELFHPPLEYIGYPNSKRKHWVDNNIKRFHGEGQPCWVIEETPAKEPWWFHKHIRWVNMKDLTLSLSLAYDKNGRLIRYLTHGNFLPDPVNESLRSNWILWSVKDLTTGFYTFDPMDYGTHEVYGESRYYYNVGMPEKDFAPETLLKEYTSKVLFWR